MRIMLYAGTTPTRESVLEFSAPIVQHCATSLAVVSGGGNSQRPVLEDALKRLDLPDNLPVETRTWRGNAQNAILMEAREHEYDLVILGRLHQALGRLLPGPRSKVIAQRLEPSVLRVQGQARPIRRILLCSGGDHHTIQDVRAAAQIAKPLGATVTLLHIISQQSVLFEGLPNPKKRVKAFLAGDTPEAKVQRDAVAFLTERGVKAEFHGRTGPVLDEILEELRGPYDLLVIGAHRVASALDRILLENIANDLLDISPLPVLVVKEALGRG